MIRKYVLAGAAAAALLTTAASLQTANAVPLPQSGIETSGGDVTFVRRGGGFRGHGRPHFHGPRPGGFGRPHFRPHFRGHPGIRIYPRSFYYYGYAPYYAPYYFDDDYYSAGPCEALRRKAERTGSRTWWNRYRNCLRNYD